MTLYVFKVIVVSIMLSVSVALVCGMLSLTLVQALSTRGSSTHSHWPSPHTTKSAHSLLAIILCY